MCSRALNDDNCLHYLNYANESLSDKHLHPLLAVAIEQCTFWIDNAGDCCILHQSDISTSQVYCCSTSCFIVRNSMQ